MIMDQRIQEKIQEAILISLLKGCLLSDECYEQSDSMHYRGFHQPTGSNSRPQQMSTIVKRHMHKSRISDDAEDNDGDADYEEEDEADDGPDDAEFEPSTSNRATNKDKDWEGEDSDEAHNSDEEIDFSDNNDSYLDKKAKGRQRGKIGQSIRSSRDRKYTTSSRQRRVKSSFDDEDDESTTDNSDSESDEDFKSIKKRSVHARKNNSRSAALTSFSMRKNEIRTSGRTVRKVSYVESEESEETDEGKKKSQKEEIEEDDGDSIGKVLWHQPKGLAAEAQRNNRSIEPVLMSHLFDSEPNWNDMELLIKCKSQSHLHCQWKSIVELQNHSGFKKVLNYTKKVTEDIRYRMTISREEIVVNDVSKEMDLDIIKKNCQVERIIADSISKDNNGNVIPEYLVKWKGLSYA